MDTTETHEALSNLRLKISQYTHGINTLDALQEHLMDITWSDEPSAIAAEAQALANHAELVIAEYTGKHISEQDLQNELRKMIFHEPKHDPPI